MAKINPALLPHLDALPAEIRDNIVQSKVTIETIEELNLCIKLAESHHRCCGDL
ncbi:hypothetical protein [Feifania hominis]|uniref:Uncharacterized protein n=1 Tax=Feifania hominis TaxID=2763660 RepID=A0A926DGG0_9FIRM|nr:hypothetical protein [Feifania hominis]MBC8536849.1 hypothetical protein [Feifania hominis]